VKKKRAAKAKTKAKKVPLYVAVVVRPNVETSGFYRSSRAQHGDRGSFLGTDREEVLAAALKAKADWEKSYGPYEILIGTLTKRVVLPTNYKVVKL
jgi:ribosomal protein L39E